jgi:hypothetical protein
MKVFGMSVVVAAALAALAATSLGFIQKTVAQTYITDADRLGEQGNVNLYGR